MYAGDEWKVFQAIEDDLLIEATDGILTVDPYGNAVRVFMDMVSFFAEYPAFTTMSDLWGHNGVAFCTFCTMRKREELCRRYLLFSHHMISRRMDFMRFDERTSVIRSGNPPTDLLKKLRLTTKPPEIAADSPFRRYSARVREAISKGADLPQELIFDSFLNISASSDHLITGLISNVLHVCFM